MIRPSVLRWLEEPSCASAFNFAVDTRRLEHSEAWASWEYEEMADAAFEIAAMLRELGVKPGDLVALGQPTGPDFVASFLGCAVVGAVPSPFAAPSLGLSSGTYVQHVAGLFECSRPRLVLVDELAEDLVRQAIQVGGQRVEVVTPRLQGGGGPQQFGRRRWDDIALVQFSSGSSGSPKGVAVSWANLEDNLGGLCRLANTSPRESMASWLPFHHDMGLIGTLLMPLSARMSMWFLRPEQFLLDPVRWLIPLGVHGVTMTAAPCSAYGYLARKAATDHRLVSMDFSSWRLAAVGAERLDPGTLRRCMRILAPFGFRPDTLRPGYGLAETTVGVTGRSAAAPMSTIRLDPSAASFTPGERLPIARVTDLADLGDVTDDEIDTQVWVMSSGSALSGTEVAVIDPAGRPVPGGHFGEIAVRSASVARHYVPTGTTSELRRLGEDWFPTGDAGFLIGDDLFVLGRRGDSGNVHGALLHAEEVEARLHALPGLDPTTRLTALIGTRVDAAQELIVVVESKAVPSLWLDEAAALLEGLAAGCMDVRIVRCRRGTVPHTSSGKPRRRAAWLLLSSGELDLVELGPDRGLRLHGRDHGLASQS